jgi:hypothetical protein
MGSLAVSALLTAMLVRLPGEAGVIIWRAAQTLCRDTRRAAAHSPPPGLSVAYFPAGHKDALDVDDAGGVLLSPQAGSLLTRVFPLKSAPDARTVCGSLEGVFLAGHPVAAAVLGQRTAAAGTVSAPQAPGGHQIILCELLADGTRVELARTPANVGLLMPSNPSKDDGDLLLVADLCLLGEAGAMLVCMNAHGSVLLARRGAELRLVVDALTWEDGISSLDVQHVPGFHTAWGTWFGGFDCGSLRSEIKYKHLPLHNNFRPLRSGLDSATLLCDDNQVGFEVKNALDDGSSYGTFMDCYDNCMHMFKNYSDQVLCHDPESAAKLDGAALRAGLRADGDPGVEHSHFRVNCMATELMDTTGALLEAGVYTIRKGNLVSYLCMGGHMQGFHSLPLRPLRGAFSRRRLRRIELCAAAAAGWG